MQVTGHRKSQLGGLQGLLSAEKGRALIRLCEWLLQTDPSAYLCLPRALISAQGFFLVFQTGVDQNRPRQDATRQKTPFGRKKTPFGREKTPTPLATIHEKGKMDLRKQKTPPGLKSPERTEINALWRIQVYQSLWKLALALSAFASDSAVSAVASEVLQSQVSSVQK